MRYIHKNLELELIDGTGLGSVAVDGKITLRGHAYLAIKEFIRLSGNAPGVVKRFKSQLDMREKPKFSDLQKKQDEYEAKLPTKKEEFKMTLSQTPRIAKKEKWKDPFK